MPRHLIQHIVPCPESNRRIWHFVVGIGLAPLVFGIGIAIPESVEAAKSPFGVGIQDQTSGGLLPWIGRLQQEFYRELTAAMKQLTQSGRAFWWLAGLSLLYGIVHAAGPGHGKIVISSYLLANEQSARKGILIAFFAAMLQASVAVGIVAVAAIMLNATSLAMTDTARAFEIGSYVLIIALGLYLLARKGSVILKMAVGRPAELVAEGHAHGIATDHNCGHDHIPDPQTADNVRTLAGAVAAVTSVGIRPCSGALIVLVFAFAQGLFWAGVASAYLMGIGTAVTVAVLATIAVSAKGLAGRLASSGNGRGVAAMAILEFAGALAITAFGVLLLGGALSVT